MKTIFNLNRRALTETEVQLKNFKKDREFKRLNKRLFLLYFFPFKFKKRRKDIFHEYLDFILIKFEKNDLTMEEIENFSYAFLNTLVWKNIRLAILTLSIIIGIIICAVTTGLVIYWP